MAIFDIAPGEAGTYFADTTERTGEWKAITVIENATFTALTVANWDGSATTGIVVGAGVTLFGEFTKIKLASGRIVAYKA
ncbi:hypothetical protein [Floridanema evergladense]|uniref:Uncharacterized protein n=1 Tax=Floridaenema evergladense BLCC-F167 TaxID=3153639 RepID=A0ABV4WD74_9CYAN